MNIPNYTLQYIDGDVQGVIRDNVSIIVHYAKNRSSVRVNHIDTNGNTLAKSEILEGYVSDEYATSAKEIYGYTLTAVPDNAFGNFADTITDINYVYDLKDAIVQINYIDTKKNPIAKSDTIHGKVFDEYMTSAKNINGYTLKTASENASGTMTEEDITVTYIYEKENKPIIITADTDDNITKSLTSPKTGADYNIFVYVFLVIFILTSIFAIILLKAERYEENESDK